LNTEGKKIREIVCASSKNPGDHSFTKFGSEGQVLETEYTNRWRMGPFKFKSYSHRKNEYKDRQLLKSEYYSSKGELTRKYIYEYAMPGKVKHSEAFHKDKKIRESFSEYNPDSTQKEYRLYDIKNGKQKLNFKFEYEYYSDKQKKETRQYNGKNKLIYKWKYDCNPKGELEKKESMVCKNTGVDNRGRLIDITFNTDGKGKKTKNIHTYYMFNGRKIHVAYENYIIEKGKEIKISDIHVADSIEPYFCSRNYNRKGVIVSEHKEEYSVYLVGKTVLRANSFMYYNKGKITILYRTSYNEKGLPVITETFDRKNKSLGKAVYKYEGDDFYTVNHYNKKEKLTEVYTGKVSYY
jgi:hypothetical protein